MNLDTTNKALLAAFAVQTTVELLDTALVTFLPNFEANPKRKSLLRLISALFAMIVAATQQLNLLNGKADDWFGIAVTAFAIGGGTEGVNSVLKYVSAVKTKQQVLSGQEVPPVVKDGKATPQQFVATLAATAGKP